MMLVLDTPIAAAVNDAGEWPARRDVARALQRMGFPASSHRYRAGDWSARSDADWSPLRNRTRRIAHGTCPARNDPTSEWRPL